MTENKLKKMAENNKFEELMNNRQELERLSKIKDISEVLDVLNRYGYNGNKQDLERDLFEILQGLSEDDLQNISGGKILNKKYLAGLMGGLTMMGAMGLKTSAQEGNRSKVKTKSETSFFNKEDKKTISIAGTSLAVGGLFVECLNLLFRKPKIEYRYIQVEGEVIKDTIIKDEDFALTEEQQKIYNNTKKLSAMLLKYVETYISNNGREPNEEILDKERPEHNQILDLIANIRRDWITMYGCTAEIKMNKDDIQKVIQNECVETKDYAIWPATIGYTSIGDVFAMLPIRQTKMAYGCEPYSEDLCVDDLPFLARLKSLALNYKAAYDGLYEKLMPPDDDEE